jgi:hypothetical protein
MLCVDNSLKVVIKPVIVCAKPSIPPDISVILLPVLSDCFEVTAIPSIMLFNVREIFNEFSLVVSERRRISPATTANPLSAFPA